MATLVITPEIEADAVRLAKATGQTPTEAVASALRAELRLAALKNESGSKAIGDQLSASRPSRDLAVVAQGVTPKQEIVTERASLAKLIALVERDNSPIDYSLTEDEILGYDEWGIPEQPYLGR